MPIGSGFTNGGRMTRIRLAYIIWYTLYIWNWIATIARWALTHGTVLISNTDSVVSANLLVANVVTGVCQTVAKLCWRAINIVDTWY